MPDRTSDGGLPNAERLSPGAALALLAVAALIVRASLFPFFYSHALHSGGPLAHLLASRADWDEPRDLVANILLYLPFGLLAERSLAPRIAAPLRVLIAALLGAAMASCVEAVQFYEPFRVSTLGDVYADAIGAAAGGIIGMLLPRRMFARLSGAVSAHADAVLLLSLFLVSRLYPLVPTENLGKYRRTLLGLLHAPPPGLGATLHLAIAWLLVAVALQAICGRRRWPIGFALLALLVCGGRVMMVWLVLQWPEVIGPLLGGLAWLGLRRSGRGGAVVLAVLLAGLLASPGFGLSWQAFGWTPLHGMLWGVSGAALPRACALAFLSGGAIWLLRGLGVGIWLGTVLTCGVLAAGGVVRAVVSGQAFGLAGLAVVAAMGGALWLLQARGHCGGRREA